MVQPAIPPSDTTPGTPGKHATLQVPQSTPVKATTSTTYLYTTHQKYRIESCSAAAREIKRHLIGPMPANQFLDDFFPLAGLDGGLSQVKTFCIGCYKSTLKAKYETKAYDPFIQVSQDFLPGFRVVNSSQHPDSNPRSKFKFDIKPDVSVYPESTPDSVKTNSALAEIFIEFKWNKVDFPFCDPSEDRKSFICDTKKAEDSLGQITVYAAAQLSAQFRTHVYSVLISHDTARILRWDRSGTVVTEPISYNESPLLAEFFRRYSKAPSAMRGKDETVSVPAPAEEEKARSALALDETVPLVRLSIPCEDDNTLYFITPTPEATLYTPPGRATRGFKAYDIARQDLVFLKDSWRIDLPDIWREGKVYEVLNSSHVSNVPNCLASNDISTAMYHATKANLYVTMSWACRSNPSFQFISHRHYRLVLDVVGRVLVDFKSSYEMVAAVRNGIIALESAYKAGILHRDFSPGNIIIDKCGAGWLIDWDLSKPISLESETPRKTKRTGTWQFMSAGLISQTSGRHDFKDDLESSIYVILWTTLMYSRVTKRNIVPPFLSGTLDPTPFNHNGGVSKKDFLKGRSFLDEVGFIQPPLYTLLYRLAELFAVRYETAPTDDERDVSQRLIDLHLLNAYNQTKPGKYDERVKNLEDHTATIRLFDEALETRSAWPPDDNAQLQVFNINTSHQPNVKTDWQSILQCPVQPGSDAEDSDDKVVAMEET